MSHLSWKGLEFSSTRLQVRLSGRFKKGFDEDSSDSEASSSSKEETDQIDKEDIQASKKQKAGPQLEDLQELGFRTGPSVLTIKEQPPDLSYEW